MKIAIKLFFFLTKMNNSRPVQVDGLNDIAAILCSSGTTGLSKGAFKAYFVFNFD